MSIFDFQDYKVYILQKIKDFQGKGPLKKMAGHLQIHGSLLSQILRGSRNLSQEQAFSVTTFFKLTEVESEYFMTMVAHHRAGTPELREYCRQQMDRIRMSASQNSGPIPHTKVVDEKHREEFYSNWYYSGIRLLTAIDKFQDAESIAKYFSLPKTMVTHVLKFLVDTGLCVKNGNKYSIGTKFTAHEVDSPFVNRTHMNWRVKALEKIALRGPDEYFLTFPMVIAEKDGPAVKSILLGAVSEIEKLIEPSPNEKLSCLNIDWFNF